MEQFPELVFGPIPAMQPVGWGREVKLLAPQTVRWKGGEITVPVGFIHDGPSIPSRLRGIVYYTHRLLRASIVHDYLYERCFWTRKRCGVGPLRRNAMWAAVRLGGLHAWAT